ncbi:unnamed protein product [Caenorhabditis brenneri]
MPFPSQHTLCVSFRPFPEEKKRNSRSFSVQIGDIVYDCRYLIGSYLPTIYLGRIGYKKASIFINYILDLVRAGITAIEIELNKLNTGLLSEPWFKNVRKIMLRGENVPAENVIELYDRFDEPLQETVVECTMDSLSPTSKLLQSENLSLDPSCSISIEHLLNFNGKYISLECSSLLEEHIVAFIKHWLDGNYPNLEGAVITAGFLSPFETEKVLNEFNTKQWNPAERAQNFILKASYSRDHMKEFPIIDCTNGRDFERSDGLLATILFGDNKFDFNFCVWHTRFP